MILLKFLRCYRSVYVLLKDAGQWRNLLQVRFYINKNLPSEIWDGLIRLQVVWTSMLKSPCLILQMARKIVELCNNNLWCVLHVRWAIYGKCFGKNDYSCASISHRFRTRLKILYCILSECCIYLCTLEEIWSWYKGLWLGRLMPMFKWLEIQTYLLTDYNTEVFINCESRLMSNLTSFNLCTRCHY